MSGDVLSEFQAELRRQFSNRDQKHEWTLEVTNKKITKKNKIDMEKKVILVSQRDLDTFAETNTIPKEFLATYGLLLAGFESLSNFTRDLKKK